MKIPEKTKEKKVVKKESTPPSAENELILPGMEKGSTLSNIERINLYIEEYNTLKKETDWRLQIAYAGPTAYISALFIAIGLAINTLRDQVNLNVGVEGGILAIAFVLGNAMFIGVFVGNHFIEKKIEMYMLELERKIYMRAGEDFYGWIDCQHGSEEHTSKFDIFAHAGVGIFQYGIPTILSIAALAVVPTMVQLDGVLVFLYGFAVCALVLAVLALFALLKMTLQVKNQYKLFFQKINEKKSENIA